MVPTMSVPPRPNREVDQQLADRVNLELPDVFDPAETELLRDLDVDASRHAEDGRTEDMSGLPRSSQGQD
jgi:hypothetical protein